MIFVFGGGFAGGVRDNKQYIPYFEFLNDNGYDVVSIDYRLGLKDVKGATDMSVREMVTLFNRAVTMAVEDLFSATRFRTRQGRRVECRPRHDRIVRFVGGCDHRAAGRVRALQPHRGRPPSCPRRSTTPGVIVVRRAVFSVDGAPEWAPQSPRP